MKCGGECEGAFLASLSYTFFGWFGLLPFPIFSEWVSCMQGVSYTSILSGVLSYDMVPSISRVSCRRGRLPSFCQTGSRSPPVGAGDTTASADCASKYDRGLGSGTCWILRPKCTNNRKLGKRTLSAYQETSSVASQVFPQPSCDVSIADHRTSIRSVRRKVSRV